MKIKVLGPLFLICAGPGILLAQVPQWTVGPIWAVSAGDGPGEGHQFLHVRDAAVLEDGRLVVLSAGTKDIRVFSPSGAFIRAVGREGEGPGEFKVPAGFRVLPSGHLLVYDPGNLRVTEFGPDWEVVGTQRVAYAIQAMMPAFGRGRPMVNGMIPVATYDVPFFEATRRREGVYEDDLVIRLFQGSDAQASVRRPRGKVYTAKEGSTGITFPLPMGEFALFNWGAEHVVLGSSHSTAFDLFDLTGALAGSVHGVGELQTATEADFSAFEKVRRERTGSFTIRGVTVSNDVRVERFLKDAPRGDHVPLFDQVEIGDDGRVWIREYVLDGDIATWQVLDPEVGIVAKISIPASWEVLRVSGAFLIAVERNEYDVEMVRAYRLVH